MRSLTCGLDIGSSSVKVVYLEKEKDLLVYKSSLTTPTPSKGMSSDSPFDQEDMANVIHQLLKDAQIPVHSVNVALSDSQVFTKIIEMPVLSDSELASAIYWEAEQYIPAPLNTITLDHKVLTRDVKTQEEPKMQVLLVGAPTELIKKYQDILALGGISIASMETESIAAMRAVVATENFPTSLIVHIGSMSTSLVIVQNNTMVFTYAIPAGGTAINRAIATDFGFTVQQADEYKKVYGLTDDPIGVRVTKAIEPILVTILGEVKKALTFYTDKYKQEAPISQILLSGGTARLPGLDLFFVRNTNIETAIINPWRIRGIQGVPQEVIDTSCEYTIAVGLALKEYGL
jgi:type IV pilus assembly protein PilM